MAAREWQHKCWYNFSSQMSKIVDFRRLRPLTTFEDQVVMRLLSVAFPGRDDLVSQLKASDLMVRSLNSDGSIIEFCSGSKISPKPQGRQAIPVYALFRDEKRTIEVILFVDDNFKLLELEFVQYDGLITLADIDPAKMLLYGPE